MFHLFKITGRRRGTVPSRSRCWQNSAYLHLCHGGKSRDFRYRSWKLCQVPWRKKGKKFASWGFVDCLLCFFFVDGFICLMFFVVCCQVPGGCLFIYLRWMLFIHWREDSWSPFQSFWLKKVNIMDIGTTTMPWKIVQWTWEAVWNSYTSLSL